MPNLVCTRLAKRFSHAAENAGFHLLDLIDNKINS